MAQKTIVQLIDDLDGGEAVETVGFALDGVEYTIDLSDANAKKLRDGLALFVDRAQRAGRLHGSKRPATHTTSSSYSGRGREANEAVRNWARKNNIEVNSRGRIAREIYDKYDAEHSRKG